MGAIAMIVDKSGNNAVPTVIAMLRELAHRGTDAYGVSFRTGVKIAESLQELDDANLKSNIAIGYNLSRSSDGDIPQPILAKDCALVFDGRIFPSSEKPGVEELASRLKDDLIENARRVLNEFDGAYAFAISHSDRIIAARDMHGLVPMYYGENRRTCGVASERKALWALGMRNVKSFPPGNVAAINKRGFAFERVATIEQPQTKSIDMEVAINHLRELLLESTIDRVGDSEKVAVAFSGGLDSSVIAALAKVSGVDVRLISVGLENQSELQHAEKASRALELPIQVQTHDLGSVKEVVSKALWLIEDPNLMKVGIAIPFFWTAEIAHRIGCRVLLAGQGSDELFGGYQRYLRELQRKGPEALREILFQDVVSSYKTNFQRDYPICAYHKVELRLPFIDREVMSFALGLPLELKIESTDDLLRKRILRRVAANLKIPDFIADRPKKAIQYATGTDKALRKIARSEGLTVRDYLNKLSSKMYPELEASP